MDGLSRHSNRAALVKFARCPEAPPSLSSSGTFRGLIWPSADRYLDVALVAHSKVAKIQGRSPTIGGKIEHGTDQARHYGR